MTSNTRNVERNSLLMMAEIRLDRGGHAARVKVRNLSDGGMMAEGDLPVESGMQLTIDLRNVGPVRGAVAWTQDNRFGIAFAEPVDAKAVRTSVAAADTIDTPRYTRPAGYSLRAKDDEKGPLRSL